MIEQLVYAVFIPAAVALLALLFAWRPWQRSASPGDGHWGAAIGLGTSFLVSFYFVAGSMGYPPPERWMWTWVLVALTTVVALAAALTRGPGWIRWILAAVPAGAAVALIKFPDVNELEPRIGLGLAIILLYILVNPIAERRRGATMPLTFLLVFATVAGILVQAKFAKIAMMSGAVSAACGMALVVALLNPKLSFARGGTMVLAALLPTLLLCGYGYDNDSIDSPRLPLVCFVLPAVAPLLLWVGEIAKLSNKRPWPAITVRAALIIVPCGVAIGISL